MSTQTNTETKPVIIVKADASVVKSIANYLALDAKAAAAVVAAEVSGYIGIAKAALPVVARQGYTEKSQVSQLLLLSFLSQAGVLELDDNDPKKVAVMDRHKSNISNLVAIIAPKDDALKAARDKALAYNDALPANCRPNLRIGQKHLLAIVRGNSTVDDVIAVKEGRTPTTPTPANPADKPVSAAGAGVQAEDPTTNEQATIPGSTPTPDGQPTTTAAATQTPVSSPSDALRHVLRTMLPNYKTNFGMPVAEIEKVATEEIKAFVAANQ